MADREASTLGSQPSSPRATRRPAAFHRQNSASELDERSPLLLGIGTRIRIDDGTSPRIPQLSRNHSYSGMVGSAEARTFLPACTDRYTGSIRASRHHSRHGSWGQKVLHVLSDRTTSMSESKGSILPHERVWYDQFTSTDWVHDAIADSHRVKALRRRTDFWGRLWVAFDGAQGWILSALCGVVVALIAYAVDVAEATVFDYKDGYCTKAWYLDEKVRVGIQGGCVAARLIASSAEMLSSRSV